MLKIVSKWILRNSHRTYKHRALYKIKSANFLLNYQKLTDKCLSHINPQERKKNRLRGKKSHGS